MLSNPPYGKSWKTDLNKLGGKEHITDPRFAVTHNNESDFKMIPRSSDGQLLFLANKISKMKQNTELGSRIVEVHNGSSLFTGDAGQGESNLRRYIIENDWLEAIIALPENMFYNTGIATFIWVVANRKPKHRMGKVQLIDATDLKSPLRKNQGNKNCELTPEIRKVITDILINFEENDKSKIFDNKEFGYWKITVEKPLRLSVDLSKENIEEFSKICEEQKDTELMDIIYTLGDKFQHKKLTNYNLFLDELKKIASNLNIKLSSKRLKLVKNNLAKVDEVAEKVIKRIIKPGKVEKNPLYGLFNENIEDEYHIVEYEADSNLRDTEEIPLLHEGGIEKFFKDEVLPFNKDAWIDKSKTQIGYKISFSKYFYKPIKLRDLNEIKADIKILESETDGLLNEIIGG